MISSFLSIKFLNFFRLLSNFSRELEDFKYDFYKINLSILLMEFLMAHFLDYKKSEIKDSIIFSKSPAPTKKELEKRLVLVENQINWLEKIRKTIKTQMHEFDFKL